MLSKYEIASQYFKKNLEKPQYSIKNMKLKNIKKVAKKNAPKRMTPLK